MANELELKAVVEDPARIRAALAAAGARRTFRGLLRDRRLDAGGRLSAADTVLRVRRWIPTDGPEAALVGWKGPASVSPEGYKQREELEYEVEDGAAALQSLERAAAAPAGKAAGKEKSAKAAKAPAAKAARRPSKTPGVSTVRSPPPVPSTLAGSSLHSTTFSAGNRKVGSAANDSAKAGLAAT